MIHYGPEIPYSEKLHARKYRGPGESFRESANRQASVLADNDEHFHAYRDILLGMRFMPGGRVQAAVGSPRTVTPYNCFVSGTILDSYNEGIEHPETFFTKGSIMARAAEAAATMRMGGGIGYDFSTLRPRGDIISKIGGRTSGPLSFMKIFDAICLCTASTDNRRGAQMGVLRIDHPDIEEFVNSKQNETELRGFNLSIAVTDEFMECLSLGRPFQLKFGGKTYSEVDPAVLWDKVMRSTWDWAEPGVLFIDTINKMNNLWYCETIAATNPCGEQPLPPYGACLLGSFNLTKYIRKYGDGTYHFDFNLLRHDIPHVIRSMDNVIDRASYPLLAQRFEARNKRRMGIGVTGLANTIEATGFKYGSKEFIEREEEILDLIRIESYRASSNLAREKGPFPMFDRDRYLQGKFIVGLPADVKDSIAKSGIRNSHLTSIAPTGTISLTADNISSGIEPVFSYNTEVTVMEFDGPRSDVLTDYGLRKFGVRGKTSADVTIDEHLDVLVTAATRVDSAVSKTLNIPSETSWEDFKQVYSRAWAAGVKGCTTYRMGGKRGGVRVSKDENTSEAVCRIDEKTGRKECE